MLNLFSRTELVVGKDGVEKLNNTKIAIFGLGGVGSFALEGLVRAGIGNLVLIYISILFYHFFTITFLEAVVVFPL